MMYLGNIDDDVTRKDFFFTKVLLAASKKAMAGHCCYGKHTRMAGLKKVFNCIVGYLDETIKPMFYSKNIS